MPSPFSRRLLLQAAAASPLLMAVPGWAQRAFPSKPIRIIVPLPAGGTADTAARVLGEQLQGLSQQAVVIDNKPGAIFQLGMQAIASAPADGYTLIQLNSGMAAAEAALKRYEMLAQLAPVSQTGITDGVLAVPANSPFKSAKELIDHARANPGKLNYGSAGPGSLEHLVSANLAKRYGFTATHIPFRGGPDAMLALSRNEIQMFTTVVPLAAQFMQKNLVRPLAVMVDRRSPLMPEVPTLAEQGIDLPPLQFWGGLAAPAGTPRPVIEALQRLVAQALGGTLVRDKYAALGMAAASSSPEEFARVISDELRWMKAAVRDADLRLE